MASKEEVYCVYLIFKGPVESIMQDLPKKTAVNIKEQLKSTSVPYVYFERINPSSNASELIWINKKNVQCVNVAFQTPELLKIWHRETQVLNASETRVQPPKKQEHKLEKVAEGLQEVKEQAKLVSEESFEVNKKLKETKFTKSEEEDDFGTLEEALQNK